MRKETRKCVNDSRSLLSQNGKGAHFRIFIIDRPRPAGHQVMSMSPQFAALAATPAAISIMFVEGTAIVNSIRRNAARNDSLGGRCAIRRRLAGLVIMSAAAFSIPAYADTLESTAEQYRPIMADNIGQALAGAKTLNEKVQANDLEGARKAWIAARVGWERAEVFTSGFVPELDEKIDTWPDALTGFHAVEARLFGANQLDVGSETNQLIFYLADLDLKVREIPLTPQGLLNGTARLAYEVGENKADGGESRFSGTSLDDMRNNAYGIEEAYRTIFASTLEARDAKLAEATQSQIGALKAALDVSDLNDLDQDQVRTMSERLVVTLQADAEKIGLHKPTLEELTQ
jgi:hypothetical protein